MEKIKIMKMEKKIILASGSPRRRELLTQIGIVYEVIPSEADETVNEKDPARVVEILSERKAVEVAERLEEDDCLVLGADTVVALDDQILGKPVDAEDAYRMLESLQGRTHQVYTGVALVYKEKGSLVRQIFHVKTDVEVIPMTEKQIREYIFTGEPMDKAGAYGIQGRFAAYIRGISGDYYNVVGLPVCEVVQRLRDWK